MKRWIPLLALSALVGTPTGGHAQGFAVTGQAGTLGVGAGAVLGLTDRVHLRGTFDFFPFEPEADFSDIPFVVELPSSFRAMVDVYPVGSFRLTGGILVQGDVNVSGDFVGSVEVGGTTYTDTEVSTLSGNMSFNTAFYGGIGFGNPIGRVVGINFDLGLGIRSEPDVDLSATGSVANDPAFIADLRQEESEIQDDANLLRFYPVISLSISFGF